MNGRYGCLALNVSSACGRSKNIGSWSRDINSPSLPALSAHLLILHSLPAILKWIFGELICLEQITSVCSKVAGVKVYLRRNWNNGAHAVTACIGLWRHGPQWAHTTEIGLMKIKNVHVVPFLSPLWLWHHGPITCTYCMGSKVLSLSRVYLYLQLICVCSMFPS